MGNDVDVASILILQRCAVIEPDALTEAIVNRNLEMVKVLLENDADVHAETDFGGPHPIYEYCARVLQTLETYHESFGTAHSLYELEKMREINKLVMDKKEKTTI